jgi:hypothetical protein
MRNIYFLISVAAFAAACGGGQTPAATPADAVPADAPPGASGDAPAAASKSFDDMDHRERTELMKTVVVPKMKPLFEGFDAEHFADFSCVTCHGPGAKRGEFDMPNADLPKLPAKGAFDALMEEKPEVMEFMSKHVLPDMASALGEAPFDPSTGEGFSCYDCHTSE